MKAWQFKLLLCGLIIEKLKVLLAKLTVPVLTLNQQIPLLL